MLIQELASKNKKLVEELPIAKPARVASESAFKGIALEASLDFAPSPDALSVVKHFKQSVEHRRGSEICERENNTAVLNEQRCSEAPLIGQDAVRAFEVKRYGLLQKFFLF